MGWGTPASRRDTPQEADWLTLALPGTPDSPAMLRLPVHRAQVTQGPPTLGWLAPCPPPSPKEASIPTPQAPAAPRGLGHPLWKRRKGSGPCGRRP